MNHLFANFQPALVIFDKDGTLIDFNFMWAGWITGLAFGLEQAVQKPISELLYQTVGYDALNGRVIAGSPLAIYSMEQLHDMTADILRQSGLSRPEAERVTMQQWFVPDPVLLARPLGDLAQLFGTLRACGIRCAVVTSDDRAPTLATLDALGVAQLTDTLVCADDGLPNKPEPDMILRACEALQIPPANAILVGDAVADMQAGRAAGVGLVVGVLSGLSSREQLESAADQVVLNVDALLPLVQNQKFRHILNSW